MKYHEIIEKAKTNKLYFSELEDIKGFLRKVGVNFGKGVFYWFVELEEGEMQFDHAFSTNTGRSTMSRKAKKTADAFLKIKA